MTPFKIIQGHTEKKKYFLIFLLIRRSDSSRDERIVGTLPVFSPLAGYHVEEVWGYDMYYAFGRGGRGRVEKWVGLIGKMVPPVHMRRQGDRERESKICNVDRT